MESTHELKEQQLWITYVTQGMPESQFVENLKFHCCLRQTEVTKGCGRLQIHNPVYGHF